MDDYEFGFFTATRDYLIIGIGIGVVYFGLLAFCLYVGRIRRKQRTNSLTNEAVPEEDFRLLYLRPNHPVVYILPFVITSCLTALLIVPMTIGSHLIHSNLMPNHYYFRWLTASLLERMWSVSFVLANANLFIIVPFAYFFSETSDQDRNIERAKEAMLVMALVGVLVFSLSAILWSLSGNNFITDSPIILSGVSLLAALFFCVQALPNGILVALSLVLKPSSSDSLNQSRSERLQLLLEKQTLEFKLDKISSEKSAAERVSWLKNDSVDSRRRKLSQIMHESLEDQSKRLQAEIASLGKRLDTISTGYSLYFYSAGRVVVATVIVFLAACLQLLQIRTFLSENDDWFPDWIELIVCSFFSILLMTGTNFTVNSGSGVSWLLGKKKSQTISRLLVSSAAAIVVAINMPAILCILKISKLYPLGLWQRPVELVLSWPTLMAVYKLALFLRSIHVLFVGWKG